jgi:hypothetical protein
VNLREDIARAARAAIWVYTIHLWNSTNGSKREKLLRDAATFLAHLQAGAVKIDGHPDEKVHPWKCYFGPSSETSCVDCFTFHIRLDHSEVSKRKVSKAAVEAVLAELRSPAQAAGTVVLRDLSFVKPASPKAARMARDVVRVIRAKLDDLNPIMVSWEDAHSPATAAAFAAIEVGNWIAEVELHSYIPYDNDISHHKLEVWVNGGHVEINVDGIDEVWIYPVRAPRAMRSAFATAYAKWYGRLVATALVEELEEAGA